MDIGWTGHHSLDIGRTSFCGYCLNRIWLSGYWMKKTRKLDNISKAPWKTETGYLKHQKGGKSVYTRFQKGDTITGYLRGQGSKGRVTKAKSRYLELAGEKALRKDILKRKYHEICNSFFVRKHLLPVLLEVFWDNLYFCLAICFFKIHYLHRGVKYKE